jgi:hypothetical protein
MIGLDREVRMPLGRRAATKLFRVLSSALAVATVYFPGRYTVNEVTICNPGDNLRLEIRGGTSSGFDKLSDAIRRRLRRIWRTLGAIALPGTTLATAGTDAHFGGLFPMGNPAAHGTSRFGELNAKPGLFVADGSVLPSIPSKFTRLTIMANADRIGRHVASLG